MKDSEREIIKLESMLRRLPELEPPVSIMENVMLGVRQKRRGIVSRMSRFFRLQKMPALRYAALAVSVVLVFWAGTRFGADSSKPIMASLPVKGSIEAILDEGWDLLNSGQAEQALTYFQQAVQIEPNNSDYVVLAGFAEAASGNYEEERRFYSQALMIQPDNQAANLNMGHNLAQSGSYSEAAYYYARVLEHDPLEPVALYNNALMLKQIDKDVALESEAWRAYLAHYRSGKWAYKALAHLNSLGDFAYRGHLIGSRRVILDNASLWSMGTSSSINEVAGLGEVVNIMQAQDDIELYVFAYADGDPQIAREKAFGLKKNLLQALALSAKRPVIHVSWFGVPENVVIGKKNFSVKQSIMLIGTRINTKEVAI